MVTAAMLRLLSPAFVYSLRGLCLCLLREGVHALKDVELTAMDANDASVLFATLYHNKLDVSPVLMLCE